MDQIRARLLLPAGRAALVGLGSVGYDTETCTIPTLLTFDRKSQLAIEYVYQYVDQHPDRWVLWIYASSVARFEQSVRRIDTLVKIRGLDEPTANVFELFQSWLYDRRNRHWLIILDNADDADFLVAKSGLDRLFDCIPICHYGVIIITSRSKDAVRLLIEEQEIVEVPQMDEDRAVALLARKSGKDPSTTGFGELARTLEFMPLAISQAAAFLQRSRSTSSVRQYLEDL